MSVDQLEFTPGILYLVSTPIGNMRDITLRALDVLAQVDLIAAEDTRKSKILLSHYNITTRMVSHHDHNEAQVVPQLIAQLKQGASIAVITDAGTPGISDPAFYIVREAIKSAIQIEVVPGPSAAIAALVLSGLATERFVFEGFLPNKKGREKRLRELATEPRTIIIYEAPNRVQKTLLDLFRTFGNRQVAVIREMTKMFEQIIRGTLEEILQQADALTTKGEFVLVVEGLTRKQKQQNDRTLLE